MKDLVTTSIGTVRLRVWQIAGAWQIALRSDGWTDG